ncbi:TolC family protein [Flavivirga aquimarina]|uniref:TolC family protein n=1 Tax=Flavivirga aquimarina TaxID=2027862 RepID=A0ABT8W5T3_9FLAO|nr:TolC family protein [Flavivirga aquimarina]MDO5968465.1 TolC family protein [Flavivirga aquimarina]
MKKIFHILLLSILPLIAFSQSKEITLEEAIKKAQKQSPDYQRNLNQNQASYWRFKNYKARFLPQLRLDATLPEFSNTVIRQTDDEGQDRFVNQNQLFLAGGLSISQNIPYTGGSLSVYSNLQRVDLFGDSDLTTYSVIPFSIQYRQSSLFYNSFKWDKKIEPLIYEESKRDFIETMEQISINTCRYYFSLLKAQMQLKISEQNLSNQDTLYQISQGRFKMGKIAENELLQMELSLLNSKNNVTTNTIELKRTSQNISRFLRLDNENIELRIPEELALFEVDISKAIEEAKSNRKAVIEFRRKRLQAENELARAKGNNKLEMSLNANLGISQNGNEFNNLFNNYNKQQYVSLNIGIPIFDWGISKSERKMAKANLDLTNNDIEQDKQEFEQEIYLHVLNWSSKRDFLITSQKAREIADKSYEITKKRYVLGKITITDLNISQEKKDQAVVKYLNSLEDFWIDYYILRQLTLYDFINDKKIEADDILYD